MKEGQFLGYLQCKLKKLLTFHRKKSNSWPMMSFIHNRSEITTWMGYNVKTKQKHKFPSNMFKINIFFLFSSCRSLDQHKDTGVEHQLIKIAIFIATHLKKRIQQFILPKGVFLPCFWQESYLPRLHGCSGKVMPDCWTYKRGFFFIT